MPHENCIYCVRNTTSTRCCFNNVFFRDQASALFFRCTYKFKLNDVSCGGACSPTCPCSYRLGELMSLPPIRIASCQVQCHLIRTNAFRLANTIGSHNATFGKVRSGCKEGHVLGIVMAGKETSFRIILDDALLFDAD